MDKLQRCCLRFCFLAVLLVACLVPLSAYAADEPIDTTGASIDIVVSSPVDGTVYSSNPGSIADGTTSVVQGDYYDVSYLMQDGAVFYVDYVVELPVRIIENSKIHFDWDFETYTYVRMRTSVNMFYVYAKGLSGVSILGDDGEVLKTFENVNGITYSSSHNRNMTAFSFQNVPVPNGCSTITIRLHVPASACLDEDEEGSSFVGSDSLASFLTKNNGGEMAVASYAGHGIFSLIREEDNQGLLAGIIEILRDMREKVVGMWNAIITLPERIWTLIRDGLIALFVPDEYFMIDYKEDWQAILEGSLGGVYESVSLIDDFYDNFRTSSTQGTIHFPEVNVPVAGETFTFGGYDVDIVPDDAPFLQVVIDGIKLVMNAVCTLAVLQAFKRKYEKVVSE